MSNRWLRSGLFMALIIISCGLPVGAQVSAPSYQVFVFWRGDTLTRENLDRMRQYQVDCCLLPATHITYNPETKGWEQSTAKLTGLGGEDAIGISFYVVADVGLWDAGWDGQPDVSVLAFITSDLCRFAADAIEKASGKVKGIILRSTDKEVDINVLKELLKTMKYHPAFKSLKEFEFGVVVKPELMDSPDFGDLCFTANIIIGDFTAMAPLDNPPRLVETDWVVSGAWKLEECGKPFIAALPMYEQVIEYDSANRIITPEASIPFDILIEKADKVTTDSAGNMRAIFTSESAAGDVIIAAGTAYTRLQPHPGKLMEIVNTLYSKNIGNLSGIALDGLPYSPSGGGHPASVFIASLKGATHAAPGQSGSDLLQDKQIQGDIKAQSRALLALGLFMLVAMLLTGLSVWRKRRLTYDEESGRFRRSGGDRG